MPLIPAKKMDSKWDCQSSTHTFAIGSPDWYNLFKRKPLVDALLDRLQHHCITLRINGKSLRTPQSGKTPV